MNVSDMYKVTVTLSCPGLTCLVCSPSSCGEFFFYCSQTVGQISHCGCSLLVVLLRRAFIID